MSKITKFLEENLPCEGYVIVYLDKNDNEIKTLTNVIENNQLKGVLKSAITHLADIYNAMICSPLGVLLIDKTDNEIDRN